MKDKQRPCLAEEKVRSFTQDGVVHVPGVVEVALIDEVLELASRQLVNPGPWTTDTGDEPSPGRFFTTRYLWQDDPVVQRFAFESGVAGLAATCMGSSKVRLYCDHLLIKEAGTKVATPWHQDIPYWPFLGKSICSVWVACSTATVEESSLEFIRGSHLWEKYFAAEPFEEEGGWTEESIGEPIPEVEATRSEYDIIGFDVEPGDAIVFSSWIVHSARGNNGNTRRVAMSTRWLGDNTTWHPHPGCDPTVTQSDTTVKPGDYLDDDERFPIGWPTMN